MRHWLADSKFARKQRKVSFMKSFMKLILLKNLVSAANPYQNGFTMVVTLMELVEAEAF